MVKFRAITSIPCFLITCMARVLSNPPDSNASAVVISDLNFNKVNALNHADLEKAILSNKRF